MTSDFHHALARERRRDAAARRSAELDQDRARGVRWSGCGPSPLPPPRTEHDLCEAAAARTAGLQDWRVSDQGRLVAAVNQAQRAAEAAHIAAETARAALSRGGEAVARRCREAADALEVRGLDLIAAAQAARLALPQPPLGLGRVETG